MLQEHANVKIGEYVIPLIGVPPSATLQECELCHDEVPLREAELSESGQVLCRRCRAASEK